jgi:hypothetical protein
MFKFEIKVPAFLVGNFNSSTCTLWVKPTKPGLYLAWVDGSDYILCGDCSLPEIFTHAIGMCVSDSYRLDG